jgi:hypothetical protein
MKCKNSISGLLEELKNLPTLLRNLFKKKKKEVNNTTLNKVADIVKDKMENLIKTGIVSNKDQMVNSIESNLDNFLKQAENKIKEEAISNEKGSLFNSGQSPLPTQSNNNLPNGVLDQYSPVIPVQNPIDQIFNELSPEDKTRIENYLAGSSGDLSQITRSEIENFYKGIIIDSDDEFNILEWIPRNYNPLIHLKELEYAKRIHKEIILPCARYTKKKKYNNPDFPKKLSRIVVGITKDVDVVAGALIGSLVSRHYMGQSVNFFILEIDNKEIVEKILSHEIKVNIGTLGLVNQIHASLPFRLRNGQEVRNLYFWGEVFNDNSIGYQFF